MNQLPVLVEEDTVQAPSVGGLNDNAPTVQGANGLLVQDGSEGRSSDDEDFEEWTKNCVGMMNQDSGVMKTTLMKEDDLIVREDDLEDDLSSSPVSDDSQEGLVSIVELLQSFREEDGHPPPTLTILTPTQGQDHAGGGHSPGREVTISDSMQGSGLFPHKVGTTTQHHGETDTNSPVDQAYFVGNWSLGYPDDTRCSPQSGNTGPDAVAAQSSGEGVQHCVGKQPARNQECSATAPAPSIG